MDPRKSGTFFTLSRIMKIKGLLITTSTGSVTKPLSGMSSIPGKKKKDEKVN